MRAALRNGISDMGERRSILIIGASIAVVIGMFLSWALAPSARNNASSIPLTEIADTATIQNYLQLSHLSIATSEKFARMRIYVISGSLKNVSDKPVMMAELKMAFTDFDGKSIFDYTQRSSIDIKSHCSRVPSFVLR